MTSQAAVGRERTIEEISKPLNLLKKMQTVLDPSEKTQLDSKFAVSITVFDRSKLDCVANKSREVAIDI